MEYLGDYLGYDEDLYTQVTLTTTVPSTWVVPTGLRWTGLLLQSRE